MLFYNKTYITWNYPQQFSQDLKRWNPISAFGIQQANKHF